MAIRRRAGIGGGSGNLLNRRRAKGKRQTGTHVFYLPKKVTVEMDSGTKTKKKAAPKKKTTAKKTTSKSATTKKTTSKTTTKKATNSGASASSTNTNLTNISPTTTNTYNNYYAHKEGTGRERETQRREPTTTEKRSLTVKEIIAEETRNYYASQIKKEEKKLRDEVKKNLGRLKAEEEALKRHKLLILLRGSKEFRGEFWGDANLVHPTDPFKNNLDYIIKLKKTKKWNEAMARAQKAGKAWEDGSLLRKYERTLTNIIGRHEYYSDKLKYKALFERFGGSIKKLCEITGLERIGLSLNPGTFIRLPGLREYRMDLAKMNNLAIVKAIDLHKQHEQSLAISKGALNELERKKAKSYEALKKKAP